MGVSKRIMCFNTYDLQRLSCSLLKCIHAFEHNFHTLNYENCWFHDINCSINSSKWKMIRFRRFTRNKMRIILVARKCKKKNNSDKLCVEVIWMYAFDVGSLPGHLTCLWRKIRHKVYTTLCIVKASIYWLPLTRKM